MLRLVLLSALVALATAGSMKMFEKNENNKYEQVLVPVSSTVIPIDDLPSFQVGAGIGIKSDEKKPKGPKPEGPIKLITIHNKKGYKNKKDAKIEEVTQEEYKKITKKY